LASAKSGALAKAKALKKLELAPKLLAIRLRSRKVLAKTKTKT
jgi:hypothetical protein